MTVSKLLACEKLGQWSKHRLFWVVANAVALAMLATLYHVFGFVDMDSIVQARASTDPGWKLLGETAVGGYCIFSVVFIMSAAMAIFGRNLR